MASGKPAEVDFERSLQELEQLVERMEQGELGLEEALKQFEHGIELSRRCQQALSAAEQRVEQLLEQNGELQIAPLAVESPDAGPPDAKTEKPSPG